MIDRNRRALETWDIDGTRYDLPVPPVGSGCLVYSCWTPCAPGHHHCARHGGADAVPPSVGPDPIAALTLAAQEDAARKAAHLGRPTYDRARGRISFGPVEVVEAPDLEAGPPKPRT